jgi:hypothetical protein
MALSRRRLARNCGNQGEAIGEKAIRQAKIVADCLAATVTGLFSEGS